MIIAVLSSHHEKGDVDIIENKLAWVETKYTIVLVLISARKFRKKGHHEGIKAMLR